MSVGGTLAFARLLGHLLSDGSISLLKQGRMHVGQAIDREAVLNDVELLTGCRPVATRYDEWKWHYYETKPLRSRRSARCPACVLDGAFSRHRHFRHSC